VCAPFKKSIRYLKWFYFLPGVIFAGVAHVNKLWVFANISVGVCALPNLVALLALNGAFFKLMNDFLEKRNKYAVLKVDSNRDYVVKANRGQQ